MTRTDLPARDVDAQGDARRPSVAEIGPHGTAKAVLAGVVTGGVIRSSTPRLRPGPDEPVELRHPEPVAAADPRGRDQAIGHVALKTSHGVPAVAAHVEPEVGRGLLGGEERRLDHDAALARARRAGPRGQDGCPFSRVGGLIVDTTDANDTTFVKSP